MKDVLPDSQSKGERPAISYLGTALIVALVMNWHWELAENPAVRDLAHLSWTKIVVKDLVAACGDVGLTLFAFWIGVIWTRNRRWTWPGSPRVYAALAALGAGWAVIAECLALRLGSRAYSELMPRLPVLGVGVLPVVQLVVLVPLAFAFANARERQKNKARLARNGP